MNAIVTRVVVRQACACWVSADTEALYFVNRAAGNDSRALYWRARAVVMHDRALRQIDSDPQWPTGDSAPPFRR